MMNPSVFLPQLPARYDAETKLWIPTIDIEPAKEFGEVITVVPTSIGRLPTEVQVQAVTEAMTTKFYKGDYIIMVGDPFIQALVAILAHRLTGEVNILRWDRASRSYKSVATKI